MTSRETPAARETPIAITLRGQFAFRISGTPVAFRRNSRDRQNSPLSYTGVRIKRMLNEFVAQNRVSAVRNGVQSSIRVLHDVCSPLCPPPPTFHPPPRHSYALYSRPTLFPSARSFSRPQIRLLPY